MRFIPMTSGIFPEITGMEDTKRDIRSFPPKKDLGTSLETDNVFSDVIGFSWVWYWK